MRDFLTVDSDDPLLADNKGILVNAVAGDLLLWDSRLVRCNTPALNIPTNSESFVSCRKHTIEHLERVLSLGQSEVQEAVGRRPGEGHPIHGGIRAG